MTRQRQERQQPDLPAYSEWEPPFAPLACRAYSRVTLGAENPFQEDGVMTKWSIAVAREFQDS